MELSERQTRILRQLAGADSWVDNHSIAEGSGQIGRETIRKDLAALEAAGLVERGHGKSRARQEALTRDLLRSLGLLSPQERREELQALMERNRQVRIATLAGIFHVSEATIRSDLAELAPADCIKVQYGKAHYLPPAAGRAQALLPTDFAFPDAIQHMADRAAQFIALGDCIFLDSSLCSLCILTRIEVDLELDIYTESLRLPLLAASRGMKARIHILGGLIDPVWLSAAGRCSGLERTTKAFASIRADATGSLRHRSARIARILEGFLPADCGFFFYLEENDEIPQAPAEAADPLPPAIGSDPTRIREIILPADSPAMAHCARLGIPTCIARESHVVMNPLGSTRSIGVATLDASHGFSRRFIDNLQSRIRQLPDLRFVIADNRMDSDTTLANLDLFVREKVDLIIEYQHEHKLGRLIAERMSRAGIPILAVDVAIPGAYYFGANNYEAGRIAGRALAALAPALVSTRGGRRTAAQPGLIVITDRGTGETSENRVAGTIDAFRESLDLPGRRIAVLDSENDPLNAQQVLQDYAASSGLTACAIACVNANLALGAIRAVQRLGLRDVAIAAHNDTLEMMKELEDPDSRLAGVVAYHPETYGERILELAGRLLRGEPVAPATYIEHTWLPATHSVLPPTGSEVPVD